MQKHSNMKIELLQRVSKYKNILILDLKTHTYIHFKNVQQYNTHQTLESNQNGNTFPNRFSFRFICLWLNHDFVCIILILYKMPARHHNMLYVVCCVLLLCIYAFVEPKKIRKMEFSWLCLNVVVLLAVPCHTIPYCICVFVLLHVYYICVHSYC